jgi:hypothetical protein
MSTLATDLWHLQAHVGEHAGFGRGARFDDTEWDADQKWRITDAVNAGCRMVYFTESLLQPNGQPIDGIPAGYQWSFLQPKQTVELAEGQTELVLPQECNGLLGDVIPASNDGVAQFSLRVVPYQTVYALRATGSVTGRPQMCAEAVTKGTAANRSSRYTLQVYPTPDDNYTLQVWYELSPGPLTDENPYPHGGAPLAECFRAAVVAAYCRKWEKGTQNLADANGEFAERLRAAIAADRKHKPLYLGLNSDHSDDVGRGRRPLQHGSDWGIPLEVNGVTY